MNCLISDQYTKWEKECDDRFNRLKANEEELNRIFIDIYGLQDELTPEVEDRDVTVRRADLQREIKSLISYAVGCMFGRYSLDEEGLVYAGGVWDESRYRSFLPDEDNCIPITDEEYFRDDIVGRFVEFIRVVYGNDTLEENLEFIAKALGGKGKSPRDTIRQYFLNSFFADHCQTYSVTGSGKRPIYWLFDSGKENGFKALVYMHRWNADTVGNLRVEYLHRMQTVYEKEMETCQDTIDNSMNNHEISVAVRRKEKLIRQIKECKAYDAKVAHIALSRIDIDLDDGVKVNYREDKSLEAVDLVNSEKLIKEFWDIVNNPQKVSINLLSDKDVFTQEIEGKHIVVICVPRAERSYRPVYIDGNPLNTYRRNGEGDYKCTREEYLAMVRDSSVKTQDMLILTEMDLSVFNMDSVHGYRQRMKYSRPGHVWEQLENIDFLQKIGAVGIGEDGKKHPTPAGLLMFGNEYDIVREYNNYFLDYQEQYDPDNRWTDRVISSSGDWSGNVYDFYFRVYNKLQQDIKTLFKLNGVTRVDDTPVHLALREALANCLVNADYYGRRGVVVIKKQSIITISNPGNSRIEIETAISGGVSDPRNSTMLKMFNFIDIGERAGSGIPNIFRVWRDQKWENPVFSETFDPDRITLSLPLSTIKIGDKKSTIKIGDKNRR